MAQVGGVAGDDGDLVANGGGNDDRVHVVGGARGCTCDSGGVAAATSLEA